jgi:hypothetical protein
VDWLKKRADAHEFHNLVGNLPLNDPDAAAEQIANSRLVSDAGQDFNGLVDWIIDETEGTALVQNDNGAGRARFGITERSHPEAWRDGDVTRQEAEAIYKRDYWDAIGADALSPGLRIVAFDAAINHGAGKARQWITESRGDPTRFLELRREHYRSLARQNPALYGDDLRGWENRLDAVAGRVGAMGASMQSQAWEQYSANRQAAAADPAAYVQTDFAVRSAREAWRAAPNSVTAAETYIAANIAAQERADIREGDRTTLPGQSLATYAGDLERYERAGDTEGFRTYSARIVRIHGRYGQRVLQDALELRGDTRWSSIVTARAATRAATGQRPPATAAAEAQSAARAETISRTAGGTARDAEAMSTEELRAVAGL